MAASMAAETESMTPVVLLPKAVTEVTMTRKIRAAIRPYSIAVAPLSLFQKAFR